MRLRVKVTSEDIEQGVKGSPNDCPVMLAFRRALSEAGVSIPDLWGTALGWYKGDFCDRNRTFWADARVGDFIHRFDHSLPVEPFEFDVEIPDGVAQVTA